MTSSSSGPKNVKDSRPTEVTLHIHEPPNRAVVTGLMSVAGWGFVTDSAESGGIVELSVDGEPWSTIEDRVPVGGLDPTPEWARRAGYRATLNTFCLRNGRHRLEVRVRGARQIRNRTVSIDVDNVGQLAESVRRSLEGYRGTKRLWVGPIDSTDFPFTSCDTTAWFDRPDAEQQVAGIVAKHALPGVFEQHFRHFIREGYIVLENVVPRDWCNRINRDLERLLEKGTLRYESDGRVEHLHKHSKATHKLWAHPEILKILSAIFDDTALPCQTLNFIHGSQQETHQDTIHLTPFPAGYMCGVWVALEDIHADSGPLVVYPGSHRLPRLYTANAGVQKVTGGDWSEYPEKFIARLQNMINDAGLKPYCYTPKAGSLLIWHENLAHGGRPRKNNDLTRKSIVSHYFARGGAAFYDSTGMSASLANRVVRRWFR